MSATFPDLAVVRLDGTSQRGREHLGGKAHSIDRMRALGLPVPPAFALPTPVCDHFHSHGRRLDNLVWEDVKSAIADLEAQTGRTFGRGPSPLLVSVRSGAAQSMPGMMDTVLNLGITPEIADILADETGDRDWARDTWARFARGYTDLVVDGVGDVPTDPWVQLHSAIGAVLDSWTNERVRAYRARHDLGRGGGTAVTVQAMVFGNRDERSGTGVLFSRDPSTGEPGMYGEWLAKGQGEDVVSGEITPAPIADIDRVVPGAYAELERIAAILEGELRDLVDIEFTAESGTIYMLQCRAGKRSPLAAVRIAADLIREGAITDSEGLARITKEHVDALRRSETAQADSTAVAQGTGASPGVGSGRVVTDVDAVFDRAASGEPIVLARPFTTPEDVPAMFEAAAVVTEVGGATSHAALVCREIGLPCVVGVGEGVLPQLDGTVVTVDGGSGTVSEGTSSTTERATNPDVTFLLERLRAGDGFADHPLHAWDREPCTND